MWRRGGWTEVSMFLLSCNMLCILQVCLSALWAFFPPLNLIGVVQSVKETLSSQFVDNCKGVIQRLTLQEHKMVWNRTTHLWQVQQYLDFHRFARSAVFNWFSIQTFQSYHILFLFCLTSSNLHNFQRSLLDLAQLLIFHISTADASGSTQD